MSDLSVLAAIDLQHDESDRHVVSEALSLARGHGVNLHLVFVIPDQNLSYVQNYVPKEMKKQVETDAKGEIDAFAASIEAGDIAVKTHIRRGTVYGEVIDLSDELRADFVVVGSNRPGLSDYFIGPNAARIARHADCSVLVVRPTRSDRA